MKIHCSHVGCPYTTEYLCRDSSEERKAKARVAVHEGVTHKGTVRSLHAGTLVHVGGIPLRLRGRVRAYTAERNWTLVEVALGQERSESATKADAVDPHVGISSE